MKIVAYMDDVSLVADDHNALKGATERLTALALVIGLRLNKTKTVAFGPFGKSLAEQLGITHDPLGLKCLGAFVTADKAAADKFLSKAVDKHEPFFTAITHLEQEVAFAILRFCGWPRLNYLTRVMPDMKQHAHRFDKLVLASFRAIAGITAPLTKPQLALIQLPVKSGGFGLRCYETLSDECYAASLDPTSNSEAVRTRAVDTIVAAIVDSDPEWAAHRKALAKRHSADWLCGPTTEFRFVAGDFSRALQLRLRVASPWAQGKTSELCRCGFASNSAQAHESHLVSCALHPGLGPQTRHNAVRDTMARFLRENGEHSGDRLSGRPPLCTHCGAFASTFAPIGVARRLCGSQTTAERVGGARGRRGFPAGPFGSKTWPSQ